MEVFHRYGTAKQKEKYLGRLMTGEIRSAFLMTEPRVASYDATNIETQVGRASGRERVCQYVEISVVAVSLKTKNRALRDATLSSNNKHQQSIHASTTNTQN